MITDGGTAGRSQVAASGDVSTRRTDDAGGFLGEDTSDVPPTRTGSESPMGEVATTPGGPSVDPRVRVAVSGLAPWDGVSPDCAVRVDAVLSGLGVGPGVSVDDGVGPVARVAARLGATFGSVGVVDGLHALDRGAMTVVWTQRPGDPMHLVLVARRVHGDGWVLVETQTTSSTGPSFVGFDLPPTLGPGVWGLGLPPTLTGPVHMPLDDQQRLRQLDLNSPDRVQVTASARVAPRPGRVPALLDPPATASPGMPPRPRGAPTQHAATQPTPSTAPTVNAWPDAPTDPLGATSVGRPEQGSRPQPPMGAAPMSWTQSPSSIPSQPAFAGPTNPAAGPGLSEGWTNDGLPAGWYFHPRNGSPARIRDPEGEEYLLSGTRGRNRGQSQKTVAALLRLIEAVVAEKGNLHATSRALGFSDNFLWGVRDRARRTQARSGGNDVSQDLNDQDSVLGGLSPGWTAEGLPRHWHFRPGVPEQIRSPEGAVHDLPPKQSRLWDMSDELVVVLSELASDAKQSGSGTSNVQASLHLNRVDRFLAEVEGLHQRRFGGAQVHGGELGAQGGSRLELEASGSPIVDRARQQSQAGGRDVASRGRPADPQGPMVWQGEPTIASPGMPRRPRQGGATQPAPGLQDWASVQGTGSNAEAGPSSHHRQAPGPTVASVALIAAGQPGSRQQPTELDPASPPEPDTNISGQRPSSGVGGFGSDLAGRDGSGGPSGPQPSVEQQEHRQGSGSEHGREQPAKRRRIVQNPDTPIPQPRFPHGWSFVEGVLRSPDGKESQVDPANISPAARAALFQLATAMKQRGSTIPLTAASRALGLESNYLGNLYSRKTRLSDVPGRLPQGWSFDPRLPRTPDGTLRSPDGSEAQLRETNTAAASRAALDRLVTAVLQPGSGTDLMLASRAIFRDDYYLYLSFIRRDQENRKATPDSKMGRVTDAQVPTQAAPRHETSDTLSATPVPATVDARAVPEPQPPQRRPADSESSINATEATATEGTGPGDEGMLEKSKEYFEGLRRKIGRLSKRRTRIEQTIERSEKRSNGKSNPQLKAQIARLEGYRQEEEAAKEAREEFSRIYGPYSYSVREVERVAKHLRDAQLVEDINYFQEKLPKAHRARDEAMEAMRAFWAQRQSGGSASVGGAVSAAASGRSAGSHTPATHDQHHAPPPTIGPARRSSLAASAAPDISGAGATAPSARGDRDVEMVAAPPEPLRGQNVGASGQTKRPSDGDQPRHPERRVRQRVEFVGAATTMMRELLNDAKSDARNLVDEVLTSESEERRQLLQEQALNALNPSWTTRPIQDQAATLTADLAKDQHMSEPTAAQAQRNRARIALVRQALQQALPQPTRPTQPTRPRRQGRTGWINGSQTGSRIPSTQCCSRHCKILISSQC